MSDLDLLVIVSGPSGVGKTTVVNEACRLDPRFEQTVSCTTRSMRPGEADGIDYHFLSEEEFADLERSGGLIESVRARRACYGVAESEIERILDRGKLPIVVLDPNGRDALAERYPYALSVFIDASDEQVADRLRGRGDADSVVAERLEDNKWICRQDIKDSYDVRLVNPDGRALDAARNLIEAVCRKYGLRQERTPSERAEGARKFVSACGDPSLQQGSSLRL